MPYIYLVCLMLCGLLPDTHAEKPELSESRQKTACSVSGYTGGMHLFAEEQPTSAQSLTAGRQFPRGASLTRNSSPRQAGGSRSGSQGGRGADLCSQLSPRYQSYSLAELSLWPALSFGSPRNYYVIALERFLC